MEDLTLLGATPTNDEWRDYALALERALETAKTNVEEAREVVRQVLSCYRPESLVRKSIEAQYEWASYPITEEVERTD